MSLVELIGFIVSLFGLFFLFGRDRYVENQRKKDPEKYARRERLLAEQLSQMGILLEEEPEEEDEYDEEEEEAPPPPPQFKAPSQHHAPITYENPRKAAPKNAVEGPSQAARFVNSLPDKRALLVSHILFGPPKGTDDSR